MRIEMNNHYQKHERKLRKLNFLLIEEEIFRLVDQRELKSDYHSWVMSRSYRGVLIWEARSTTLPKVHHALFLLPLRSAQLHNPLLQSPYKVKSWPIDLTSRPIRSRFYFKSHATEEANVVSSYLLRSVTLPIHSRLHDTNSQVWSAQPSDTVRSPEPLSSTTTSFIFLEMKILKSEWK